LDEIRQIASYRPDDIHGIEMVAIRGVDDEAALALAMGSVGTLIGKLVINKVIMIMFSSSIPLLFWTV
jgi:hypothetical protein